MDNEAAARLKFDRRMSKRGGWVEDEELAKELASLPDCTDKIADPSEEPTAPPKPEAAPPAPQAASTPEPEAPVSPLGAPLGGGNADS